MRALLVMRYLTEIDPDGNLIYHEKKFDGQIRSLCNMGYDCTYFMVANNTIYKLINREIVDRKKLPFSYISILFKFVVFYYLYKLSKKESETGYDLIYVRNAPFVLQVIPSFKSFKKNSKKFVVEIPTYPAVSEVKNDRRYWVKLMFLFGLIIEKFSSKYVDLYAIIGEHSETYMGRPAINITNGTDICGYKIHTQRIPDGTLHIIGVGKIANYHGFDRIIRGMSEYYKKGGKVPVFFHIVGPEGDGSKKEWSRLTCELQLQDNIFFEGRKIGKELDLVYDSCDIACSSLADFRKCTYISNSASFFNLKDAESCSRGIPFMSFNRGLRIPYNFNLIPEDESPINIDEIISFVNKIPISQKVALELREFAKKYSWEAQFKKILNK